MPNPDRKLSVGFSRRALLGGAGAACGAIVVSGLSGPAISAPSPDQDVEVLNFVLDIERLQEAFYAEARSTLGPGGEWGRFVRVVGGQERAHREFVEAALKDAAGAAPVFDFGDLLADQASFQEAAVALEEAGVAAYNGQATNLTPKALATAARIVSVEARHASWARDLARENPAPRASDRAIGVERAKAELGELGVHL